MNRAISWLVTLTVLLGGVGQAKAAIIYWNTWTSNSGGSMTVGSTPVTVTFTTNSFHSDIAKNLSRNEFQVCRKLTSVCRVPFTE
jgi:hypothetical protein